MSTTLPTPSIPDSHHNNAPHPSRASIALIAASLFSFVLFVFLSVHRRPSRDALATPSSSTANKPSSKYKPRLWEVCLDEDDHRELTRLDGAVRNWQVSHTTPWITYVSRDVCSTLLANHRMDGQSSGAVAPQPTSFCTTRAP